MRHSSTNYIYISALYAGEWSAWRYGRSNPSKNPTVRIEQRDCWVPVLGLLGEEKNTLPLWGIESRYLILQSHFLITITTETPTHLWVCNINRKIKKIVPNLGEIFVLYKGRAQFVASVNRLIFSVTSAVSYKGWLRWLTCSHVLTAHTSRHHDTALAVFNHFYFSDSFLKPV